MHEANYAVMLYFQSFPPIFFLLNTLKSVIIIIIFIMHNN